MKINVPKNVQTIITAFERSGFEACAVGGCIRDSLLGREPKDWDIATSAQPQEIKSIFHRTVDTGIKHGTVTVLLGGEAYEVTTYRVDGDYEDCRHPKQVSFTPNLKEDLARRDFTINAMAYSDSMGLVDLFGGAEDLKAGIIRCVGVPKERFSEDALRIMRALRFSAQLGFNIDPETDAACREMAGNLKKVSMERIRDELTKLLASDEPGKIRRMYDMGITALILPEFDTMMETEQDQRYHCYNVGEHTIKVVQHVSPNPLMRWAALMHDIAKPQTKTVDENGFIHFKGHGEVGATVCRGILKRYKFDNASIDFIVKLVRWHVLFFEQGEYDVRRCLRDIGPEMFPRLMELEMADAMGKKLETAERPFERCRNVQAMCDMIIDRGDCYTMDSLAVKGRDLIDEGVEPGPKMGEILETMLIDVLHEPSHNNKEYLLQTYLHA